MIKYGPKINLSTQLDMQFVGFDVDGTLVTDNTDQLPSRAFGAQVARACRKGVRIGIIGARGFNKTEHILRFMQQSAGKPGLMRYHGLANGALIYDAVTDTFVQKHVIPREAAVMITQYLRGVNVFHWVHELRGKDSVDFAWIGASGEATKTEAYGVPKDMWVGNAPSNQYEPTAYEPQESLVIVADGLSLSAYEKLLSIVDGYEAYGLKAVVYKTDEVADTRQVFVLNEKANKGDALATIAALYGIDAAHCAVVGDGGNDKDRFRVSVEADGLALAMGNAKPDLKALATHILPRQDDDGANSGLRYILDNYTTAN